MNFISLFDQFVLQGAFITFTLFIVLQIIVFRFISAGGVLKWLMNFLIAGLVLNILFNLAMLAATSGLKEIGWPQKTLLIAMSAFLYGLCAFLYVVCIFGSYESSLRLRILRELYKAHPRGLSEEELLTRYNAELILRRRLDRLLCSKEITFDGKAYKMIKQKNFFLFADWIAKKLDSIIAND